MLDQQINEQLGLLQKELSRLKTVTDYIDGAKENSISIIAELEKVQNNYSVYTDKIFNLYKQYVDDLKKNTEIQINEGVLQFETVAQKVESSNNEKIEAINSLLEHYRSVVEASNSLIETLTAIDFPTKLDALSSKSQLIIESITSARQALEIKLNESQSLVIEKINTAKEQIIQNSDSKINTLNDRVVEATNGLKTTLSNNFEEQSKRAKTAFDNLNILVEKQINQTTERIDKQDKEITTLKILLFVAIGIIIIGIVLNFVLK